MNKYAHIAIPSAFLVFTLLVISALSFVEYSKAEAESRAAVAEAHAAHRAADARATEAEARAAEASSKGAAEAANSASAAYAGHASVACTSGGTPLPALPVADGLGAAHGNARQFFITPTSTDIVRLVSKNGVAASQGTAICTDASLGCSTKMPVPTSTDLWTCQADSTTATISLLGIRY